MIIVTGVFSKKSFWMLNISRIVSYEITLVHLSLSVRLSVRH